MMGDTPSSVIDALAVGRSSEIRQRPHWQGGSDDAQNAFDSVHCIGEKDMSSVVKRHGALPFYFPASKIARRIIKSSTPSISCCCVMQ